MAYYKHNLKGPKCPKCGGLLTRDRVNRVYSCSRHGIVKKFIKQI